MAPIKKDDELFDPTPDHSIRLDGNGGRLSRMTIGIGTACVIIGMISTAIWDASKYDSERIDLTNRVHILETEVGQTNTTLALVQTQQTQQADRITGLADQVTGLNAALAQANQTLQKLSESNARLEERVIFLVSQVSGRMPVDKAGTLK